jgi:DNA-binding NarL/FixJ family response regulator
MGSLLSAIGQRQLRRRNSKGDLIMKKSVIVVEDDRGLRQQIVAILGTAADIRCLGAYASAEEALPQVLRTEPDVVLMDIKLPGMSGIDCVIEIKKHFPAMQIVMVTVYKDSERIFQALKAGASGYLIKSSPPEQLLAAIRDAYEGGAPMSSHIARRVVEHFHSIGPSPKETENLSPREREVLDLLAMGCIYKEIGDQLGIGVATVRTYVKKMCHKMHVRNRMEAVAKRRTGSG